ncbi:hypothetical protein DSO57_1018407 [Entomophthora muscae]|uniref:Uncharacterized protein n=1 Tax=Entomophthora muscae TaxID=34485 RepID=A0ACC2STG5_9FUNG|nr:hypothetical protein DSO57_1018407 [Entomophthora muscae]
MEAPLTPKPDCLHPTPGLSPPTANQYAGIAYIPLAGLVDTMVSASGPWALVGQSASYLIKLASLLWWVLPSSQPRKLAAEANSPSPGMQFPETGCFILETLHFCRLGPQTMTIYDKAQMLSESPREDVDVVQVH